MGGVVQKTDIRKARDDELEECEQLFSEAFQCLVREFGRELSDVSFAMLPDAIKASRVMIATNNAKLQGAAIYSDNEGTRTIIYVGNTACDAGQGDRTRAGKGNRTRSN